MVALAATGGKGAPRWSVDGPLPAGLSFDPSSGQIRGTPRAGTAKPAALVLRVGDGDEQVSRPARLVVYQSDKPLTTPAWWKPGIPPVPWRAWLEHGFGFLVLWLVYLVSMNAIASLERGGLADAGTGAEAGTGPRTTSGRSAAGSRPTGRSSAWSPSAPRPCWRSGSGGNAL